MVRGMSRIPIKPRHLPLIVLTGCLAFTAGAAFREPAVRAWFRPSFLAEWYRVGRVMRVVNTRYLEADSAPYSQLARNASAGAAAKLDRYSEYLDDEDYAAQNKHSEQLFTGVGIIMRPVDGLICVDRALPGGGAEAAGLRAGDRIVAADGHDLTGIGLEQASTRIKGAENTDVALAIRRPGENDTRRLTVRRRTITVSTVAESRMLADGRTAYVQVSGFERRTPDEVRRALDPLLRAGATAAVLDLRGNPGGLVDAAVATVGLFCPQHTLAVKIEGRNDDDRREYRTADAPAYPKLPLAVLVDNHSASASEIVAGALRDHRRAVLVGARTFGKGLVQSIYRLDDTTGLKLTTARYTLPAGSMIHGVGVAPDVAVAESSAIAGRRAIEDAQLAYGGGAAMFRARFGYAPEGDEALRTARELLAAR